MTLEKQPPGQKPPYPAPTTDVLDEVAGGLTEHECNDLVELIKGLNADGVSIVWIEHIVHALAAVVSRLAVLHGGQIIAEGEPAAVVRTPRVQEIYMGIPADD